MRRLLPPLLATLAALAATACLTLVYLKQAINPGLFFNSDALYLPALYYDLFERGGHLRQWFLTPAPYFLPDWPLYFGLRALSGSVYHALGGVMAVQALALWALAALLLRRLVGGANAMAGAALALAAVCWGAVHDTYPYTYIMLATYHFGTFLMVLLSLLLLLPRLSQPGPAPRASLAWLALLAAATTLSDRLYLAQFAAPALLLLWLHRRRLPAWRPLCLALALGCVGGLLLSRWRWLLPNAAHIPWALSLRQAGANLRDIGAIVEAARLQNPFLTLFVVGYYAGLLAMAPGTLLGKGWRWSNPVLAWLALFNLASAGATIAAMAISSVGPTPRYLIPVFVLPVLLAPAMLQGWLARVRPAPARAWGPCGWALAALLMCWPLLRMVAQSGPVLHEYYPADIACADRVFEQYDLRHGVAGYWDASWVAMNSRRKPTIAPIEENLRVQKWITTADNFRGRYDFALVAPGADEVAKPHAALLIEGSGAPLTSVVCGTLKILVYPQDALRVGAR